MDAWLKELIEAKTPDDVSNAIKKLAKKGFWVEKEAKRDLITSKENDVDLTNNVFYIWAKLYAFRQAGKYILLDPDEMLWLKHLEEILQSEIAKRQPIALSPQDLYDNFRESLGALTILQTGLEKGRQLLVERLEKKSVIIVAGAGEEKSLDQRANDLIQTKKKAAIGREELLLVSGLENLTEQQQHVTRMMDRLKSGALISMNDVVHSHLSFHKKLMKQLSGYEKGRSYFARLKERFLDTLGIGKPSTRSTLLTVSSGAASLFKHVKEKKTTPDEVAELLDAVRNLQDNASSKGFFEALKTVRSKIISLFESKYVLQSKSKIIISSDARLKVEVVEKIYKSDFNTADYQNLLDIIRLLKEKNLLQLGAADKIIKPLTELLLSRGELRNSNGKKPDSPPGR